MPTYEYECKNCGHTLEEIQKLADKPLVVCPECKKKKLERVIGACGVIFKGSGWFKTSGSY